MDAFSSLPGREEIIKWLKQQTLQKRLSVNGHVHTPYSFSAFENIEDIFIKAREENIKVLGINDFYVADGYDDFFRLARQYRIFPLFNIEFIGLLEKEQQQNIRVNDPNNPGRTYFSGKGLRYPFAVGKKNEVRLRHVIRESQQQVVQMVEKLQPCLHAINAPFSIAFEEIKQSLAKELVRERHIAKMLRIKINDCFQGETEKKQFLTALYSGRESRADLHNPVSLEEELRGNLLKSGGIAFVPESPEAFLPLAELIEIIVDAGGIPCYPVLLDDKDGKCTEFEADFPGLHRRLRELNVGMIELIPGRNDIKMLKRFVEYFDNAGFVILFGTEHNSPSMIPLTISSRGKVPLDDKMLRISEQGCCLVAAHQYLSSKGYKSIVESVCRLEINDKSELIALGRAVIEKFINI